MGNVTLTPPEGFYDADVMSAWSEMDFYDKELLLCFDLALVMPDDAPSESVTARHFTTGEYAEITRKICTELLGLSWPSCLRNMDGAQGKRVRVRVKHKDGKYVNAYIVTGKERKPASKEQVEMAIAKLEVKEAAAPDDDGPALPF